MSRVTIDNIQHDASGLDNMSWADITKLYQIEVVPRRMVEMIIERCIRDMCSASNDGAMCYEASCIKDYAESLLEQFEED